MRVALQVTCLNDALFPDVGKAVVTVWPFDRMGGLSGHHDVFSQVPEAGSNRSLGPPPGEPHTS